MSHSMDNTVLSTTALQYGHGIGCWYSVTLLHFVTAKSFTCGGATPSLALRINSLMLIPAPFLVPEAVPGFVGVPCGVP